MKLVYEKSKQLRVYKESGSIWGVLECVHPDTNKPIKLSGTLDRYPIQGVTVTQYKST